MSTNEFSNDSIQIERDISSAGSTATVSMLTTSKVRKLYNHRSALVYLSVILLAMCYFIRLPERIISVDYLEQSVYINVTSSSGSTALFGTLTIPKSIILEKSVTAIILPGSGPTDHDGNANKNLQTNTYLMLARELAQRGITTLRYDKRGVGRSAAALVLNGGERNLRFQNYTDDTLLWLTHLKTHFNMKDTDCLYLVGHSEVSNFFKTGITRLNTYCITFHFYIIGTNILYFRVRFLHC